MPWAIAAAAAAHDPIPARLPTRLTRLSCRSEPALHAASGMSEPQSVTGAGRRQRTSSRRSALLAVAGPLRTGAPELVICALPSPEADLVRACVDLYGPPQNMANTPISAQLSFAAGHRRDWASGDARAAPRRRACSCPLRISWSWFQLDTGRAPSASTFIHQLVVRMPQL
jgi:hypothetical protein